VRLGAAIAPASRAVGRPPLRLLDRYDFGPVVDGVDVPAQPFDPEAPAIADDIPLLIGGTREESGHFLADDDEVWNRQLTEASLRRRLGAVAGSDADRALDLYRKLRPGASREDLLIAALTGSNFWVRTVMLAERKARRVAAPVWMYSLDWRSPACGGRLEAHHAMDLPFVFDTVEVAGTTRGAAGARELAAAVANTWAAFARWGNPQNPGLPPWPAYTPQQHTTMVFDTQCRVVADPDRDARLLWEAVATRA
jgi:para-nitrobenzyl esterase